MKELEKKNYDQAAYINYNPKITLKYRKSRCRKVLMLMTQNGCFK